jgi:hypothetical protein
MIGPSSVVVPFRFPATADQDCRLRQRVTSRRPPDHLHTAAKIAWSDIVGMQGLRATSSDAELELAAVLLARYRDGGMPSSWITQMNMALAELGLSRGARARLRD